MHSPFSLTVRASRWFLALGYLLAPVVPAELVLTPAAAPSGAVFSANGHVPPGSKGVRLLWRQGSEARGYLEGPVSADGSFALSVAVPAGASAGMVSVHSLPTETVEGPIDAASFQVLPQPTGTVTGTVSVPVPGGPPFVQPPPGGTKVCLKDAYGQIVACTTTAPDGTWTVNVAPGTYTVVSETTGTDDPPVTVDPGSTTNVAVQPLPGIGAQVCDAKFFLADFQVETISDAALLGQSQVSLGRPEVLPMARFVSFAGKTGAPEVNVAFKAKIEATCGMGVARVSFTLRDSAGTVLFQKLTDSEKSPQPVDTRQAIANVSLWPAGTHVMEVQVLPKEGTFPGISGSWSFPVEVVDLSARWLSANAKKEGAQPMIKVAAMPADHALAYSFHALVPKQAIELTGGDFSVGPISLENHAKLGITVDEHYDTERHWGGLAVGGVDVALLKLTAFKQTAYSLVDFKHQVTFTGPKADAGGFLASGYDLPLLSLGYSAEEMPIYGAGKQKCIKFCFVGCKKCVGFKIGLFAKIEGGADLGMRVAPDFGVRAVVAPCVKASLPLIFQLDAIICSAGAKVVASATARLPIRFDAADGLGLHFDKAGFRLELTLKYYARCFGVTFFRGSRQLVGHQWGDPGPAGGTCDADWALASTAGAGTGTRSPLRLAGMENDPPLTPDEEAGPVKEEEIPPLLQPAVSVNGACQTMTVWIGGPQEGADADGRLRFSVTDAGGSSVPANLDPAGGMAESPTVTWLDGSHALAVWVQSNGAIPELAYQVEPAVPATLELAYSIWDAAQSSWSPPKYLTNDDRWDLRPVLAADPGTGDAMLVWLRQHAVDPAGPEPLEPRGLFHSRFHAGVWSTPEAVFPSTTEFHHQPTVRFDHAGTAHLVVVADADGNPATAEDRTLQWLAMGPTGWVLKDVVPAPAGAFAPTLDFDAANSPVVAYLVPGVDPADQKPVGGEGNGSTIGLAQRVGDAWRLADVAAAGERPTLRIDAKNRALVLFRRFGHGEQGGIHDSGDRGMVVSDLDETPLAMSASYATGDGQLHWEPAFDVDPAKGCAAFGESTGTPLGTGTGVQFGAVKRGPDLAVVPGSFRASDPHPLGGQVIDLELGLVNQGLDPAVGGFRVRFYEGVPLPGKAPFAVRTFTRAFASGFSVVLSLGYTNLVSGLHSVSVVIDEENSIAETDESNNLATVNLGEVPSLCGLTARPTDDGKAVQLEWPAPTFATDAQLVFFLHRRTLPDGPWEIVGFSTQLSFVDPLAKPGFSYEYRVSVRDGAGVFSTPCGSAVTRVEGRPVVTERPVLTVRSETGRGATLSWASGRTEFVLEATSDLSATPVVWRRVAGTVPNPAGGRIEAVVPTSARAEFYRLRQP